MQISVCIITLNEEANLGRTLASVQPLVADGRGEIILVDSGSTDRTVEIAKSFGAKVFAEPWKGFAAQKNTAIEKAQGQWILSLDADEEVSPELAVEINTLLLEPAKIMRQNFLRWMFELRGSAVQVVHGFRIARRNMFLGRWMRHGGYWPDKKLRYFQRGFGRFKERAVHETVEFDYGSVSLQYPLIHHAYPTLESYLEHMRRYAELGGEMQRHKPRWWLWLNRWLNPPLTFFYNYIVRLGFLDGREGLLLHWNHSRYVHWKYTRAWELSRVVGR